YLFRRPVPAFTLFPYTTLFRSFLCAQSLIQLAMVSIHWLSSFKQLIILNSSPPFCLKSVPASISISSKVSIQSATNAGVITVIRSEEHTSELQSREISYAVFCL